jgi:hypothetical protein
MCVNVTNLGQTARDPTAWRSAIAVRKSPAHVAAEGRPFKHGNVFIVFKKQGVVRYV